MNKKVFELMEEGRLKLRAQEEEAKRIVDEAKAEQDRKVTQAKEAITQAICGNLPEALWPFCWLPEFDNFIPYECEVKLVLEGILPIVLTVQYNVDAKISGKWIVVAGIRYSPPQFEIECENEIWEGEISFPVKVGEREYGLDAFPYYTNDITVALAIAEDRYNQVMELEIARKKAIETMKAQIEERKQKVAKNELHAPEQIIPAEQFDGIQVQVGQLNPLVVFEGWIREVIREEIASRAV